MGRLEKQEGMRLLGRDQRDGKPCSREQGKRASVRGAKRTMFGMSEIGLSVIENVACLGRGFDEFRAADTANLSPGSPWPGRHRVGNRRCHRAKQYRNASDPGGEEASDFFHSHTKSVLVRVTTRKLNYSCKKFQSQWRHRLSPVIRCRPLTYRIGY